MDWVQESYELWMQVVFMDCEYMDCEYMNAPHINTFMRLVWAIDRSTSMELGQSQYTV